MPPITAPLHSLLEIAGGLAIFLFSMKLLSNSLQNLIGGKIEYALRHLTSHPAKGMLVGTFVTFLTQSSSITVLTLIGLVNVGVLNLNQGIGILLGAEIGTTITAQLVTFKIGTFYFPLLIVGLILSQLNRDQLQSTGKVLFSFGLLFLSMEFMKQGAQPLSQSPAASAILTELGHNPLLGIITGALFTGITSSSSATTSLVVALGASSAISLPAAIALMLGANIGTTFLELAAIVGMSLTAKRVAVAQALINILGVIAIFPFLGPFANLTSLTSVSLSHQIANSHTIFNIASSLVFLTCTNLIVTLTKKLAPGKIAKIERGTKYLDPHILNMPHIALIHATREINRMGKITTTMFTDIHTVINGDNGLTNIICTKEDHLDSLQTAIETYLKHISEHDLNQQTSQRLAQLSHGITDIERASDHLKQVAIALDTLSKKRLKLSTQDTHSLSKFTTACSQAYSRALKSFINNQPQAAAKIPPLLEQLNHQKRHPLKQYSNQKISKHRLLTHAFTHLERAAHHGENLSNIITSGI